MDSGIYTATSGGLVQSRMLELISNNLANVNTVGYKAERLINRGQEFEDKLASKMSTTEPSAALDFERVPGVMTVASVTDFSQGPISNTGNPLNVALSTKNTFFVVENEGQEAFTRAGNFTLNNQRQLVSADGKPVLGQGGPITIPPTGQPKITSNGSVTVNGVVIDRLRTVQVADVNTLQRQEGARFVSNGQAAVEDVQAAMVPESVEMPNVNIVDSMVQMIAAQRGFEMYQKTVRTMDDMNEQSLRINRGS